MSKENYDTNMSKVSNNNTTSLEEMCPLQNGSKHNEVPCEKSSLTATDEHYEANHISKNDDVSTHSDTDDESDTQCGWGPCSPKWFKMFASKQVFLAVFCMAWVLQGMYHTYFVSVITTIEKLFQIQSKITGIIMSATEIGQIGSSLLLTYYGGQGHRPKWIAWGVVLFAVSSFTCSLPHFIYGEQLIKAINPVGNTRHPNVCKAPNFDLVETFRSSSNTTNFMNENLSPSIIQTCNESDFVPGHQIQPGVTNIVLAIFFVSLLGVGMGQTAVYTLGIPYMDDNISNKQSPLYFAITIGVRILGPAFGFIVGSFCTSIYADLSVDPGIDSSDPKWVGAWWLGLVAISGLLIVSAIAMFAFPKRLPHNNSSFHNRPKIKKMLVDKKQNPSLRDFRKTVKRLLKNDILMFRTASSVLHILPIAGLYTFLPKYLESQFRLPTPTANMISGVGGILVMGVGIVISGIFILKGKPNARFVAGWIAFTAIVYAIGMGILMFIGCPMDEFAELKTSDGLIQLSSCNKTLCNCNEDQFEPICGDDGKTYLSPCHAGCQNFTKKDGKITGYVNCMCLSSVEVKRYGNALIVSPLEDYDSITSDGNATIVNSMEGYDSITSYGNATIGYCDQECGNFILYIVLFSIFVFVHSTSEVGSMLLILRCVDPKDKAMALGLIQFAIGLFGNVPCPIIYGAVVDSACRIWKMACGEQGACGLYDADTFRMFYHGTTGALLLCAFFVDVIVWYKAGSINFVDEQQQFEEELATIAIKIKEDNE